MAAIQNPLFDKHEAHCSYAGCGKGHIIFEEAGSAGYKIGDVLPKGTDLTYGKCPLCRRYQMKVVKIPERSKPAAPKGWSSIPKE